VLEEPRKSLASEEPIEKVMKPLYFILQCAFFLVSGFYYFLQLRM